MRIQPRHCVIVAILLVEILSLIWYFRYLPMTDLPEHMLTAKVVSQYDEPATGYDKFFTRQFPWNPYSSYFLFVLATGRWLGVQNATRVYLSLAFVLTVLAFWQWLRTVAPGRDAQVIPGTLLLFSTFFYIGVINFLFSAPFFFIALTLSWKLLERDTESRGLEAGLALAILAAYFSHVVTFGLLMIAMFSQWLLLFRGRNVLRIVRAGIPCWLVFAMYLIFESRNEVPAITWSWESMGARLEYLLLPFNVFRDAVDHHWVYQPEVVVVWTVFLALTLLGTLRRRTSQTLSPGWPLYVFSALLVAATLALPSNLSGGLNIAARASYFAAFSLVGLLPAAWDDRVTSRWLMVAVCAISPILLAFRISVFQAEMRDLEQVVNRIPPQRVIQPVITEPHSRTFHTYTNLHAAAWYSYYKGGVSPYLFAAWQKFLPIREQKQFIPNSPGEWSMSDFKYDLHQGGTEYFLVNTKRQDILNDLAKNVPRLAASGDWVVFGPNHHD